MVSDNNLGVALTKDACPVCGAEQDGDIVLNSILTPQRADAVRDLHGKVVSFKWCDECKKVVASGGVWLVEVDPTRSAAHGNTLRPENAYRTGNAWAITREAAERVFVGVKVEALMFIDQQAARALGLPAGPNETVDFPE